MAVLLKSPVAISMPQSCRDWPLKTAIRKAMADTAADTAGLGNAYVSAMWGATDEHFFLAMALVAKSVRQWNTVTTHSIAYF